MTSRLLVAAVCSSCLAAQGPGSRVAFAQSYLQPDAPLAAGYDEARGEGVFWGSAGVASSGALGAATWIWDGFRWRPRYAATYPTPASGQAMAWDPVGSGLVLFGGYDNIARSYLGDTWRWDGKNWSRASVSGPSPRWGHAMATDPIRRRVVLFGGADRVQYFTDTWEWDGRTWTQMTPPQVPIGRLFPFFCWNPKTQRVALLGGEFFGAYVVLLPCTEWDGSNWIPIAGAMQGGPLPALVRGLSFPDPDAGGVRIVGTATSLGGNPVSGPVHYLWDGQRLIRKNVSGATPTSGAGAAFFDAKKQEVISFASRSGRVRDTTAFDPRSGVWSERVRVDGSDWNLTFMSRPCLVPWIDAYIEFSASGTWLRTDAGYVRVGPLPAVQGSFMQATPFADPNQRVVYAYSPPGALMWRLTPWGVWNLLTTGMPSGCAYVGFDPLDGRHVFFDQSLARFIKWSEAGIQVLCNLPSLTGSGNHEVRGAVDPARRRLVVSVKWPAAGRQDLFEWDGATWQSVVHPNGARPGTLQYVSWLGVVLQTGRELWSWDGQAWSLVSAELPILGGHPKPASRGHLKAGQ